MFSQQSKASSHITQEFPDPHDINHTYVRAKANLHQTQTVLQSHPVVPCTSGGRILWKYCKQYGIVLNMCTLSSDFRTHQLWLNKATFLNFPIPPLSSSETFHITWSTSADGVCWRSDFHFFGAIGGLLGHVGLKIPGTKWSLGWVLFCFFWSTAVFRSRMNFETHFLTITRMRRSEHQHFHDNLANYIC